MKIKKHHLEFMQIKINQLLNNNPDLINQYETGQFRHSDRVQDLQKRFCFDVMFHAGLTSYVCNDDNIYTELKSICPKIERKY